MPCHVLEVASGTGQHGAYFAQQLAGLSWQPTDLTDEHFGSIEAWRQPVAQAVRAPILLDATAEDWPSVGADAIFCSNMIHIAPFEATLGLLRGAGSVLPVGGPLVLYGPFRQQGGHTAPSNAAFDSSLKARDPRWGVRDLDEVVALAARQGLHLDQIVVMSANNLTVVLRRGSP